MIAALRPISRFWLAPLALLSMATVPLPAPAPAVAASPLEGTWRNMKNTIHIRAARCAAGTGMCGTVISAAARHNADSMRGNGHGLVGMQLFRDFRPVGQSVWKGAIYVPDIDRTASGKIVLTDRDSITVSGCLLLGLACKTQHWKRIG